MRQGSGANKVFCFIVLNSFAEIFLGGAISDNVPTPNIIRKEITRSGRHRITSSTTTVVQSGSYLLNNYDDDFDDTLDIAPNLILETDLEKTSFNLNLYYDDDVYNDDDDHISESKGKENTISPNSEEKHRIPYNSNNHPHPNTPSSRNHFDDLYLDDGFYDDSSKFVPTLDDYSSLDSSSDSYYSKKDKSSRSQYSKKRGHYDTRYPTPSSSSYSKSSKSHTDYSKSSSSKDSYSSKSSYSSKGYGSSGKGSGKGSHGSSSSKGSSSKAHNTILCERGDYAIRPI